MDKSGYKTKSRDGAEGEEMLLPNRGLRQVLLLGLDGSGKSSFLWMCEHPGEVSLPPGGGGGSSAPPSASTTGVLRLTRKDVHVAAQQCAVNLDLAEVGGGERIRPFWPHYLKREIKTVAFFVDCSASARLGEAAVSLANLWTTIQSAAPFAAIVLVASKVDVASSRAPEEVCSEVLKLAKARNSAFPDNIQTAQLALRGNTGGRSSADALLQKLACLVLS